MKKFYIKTLGCKTNHVESELISQNLVENGFERVSNINCADIYVLNSCAVTHHAESQANYLLHYAKRKNPKIKTVLVGCMCQTTKEVIEGADIVLGNKEKLEISKHLKNNKISNIFDEEEFNFHLLNETNSTRPSIKIQDGCDNRCAYCIIPYARGKSRSNKIENVIRQIEILNKKEIVLTGIHIGEWGREWGLKLIDLLKEIEKTSVLRYRLGSLYVNEIDDELLEFLKRSKKFCPHFHLSLQSMCDKTLKSMNRKYSVEDIFNLVQKLNFNIPTYIGCDIIVGFPNENDEDFIETYNNLKKLGVSKIHVFPYSKRQGTPAATMKEQVREGIKTERVKKIMELSNVLYDKFIERNKDIEHEFLFEKKSKKNGLNPGVSRNYIKAFFKIDEDLKGRVRPLKLNEAYKICR